MLAVANAALLACIVLNYMIPPKLFQFYRGLLICLPQAFTQNHAETLVAVVVTGPGPKHTDTVLCSACYQHHEKQLHTASVTGSSSGWEREKLMSCWWIFMRILVSTAADHSENQAAGAPAVPSWHWTRKLQLSVRGECEWGCSSFNCTLTTRIQHWLPFLWQEVTAPRHMEE